MKLQLETKVKKAEEVKDAGRNRRRSDKAGAGTTTIARMKAIVVKEFGAPDVMKLEDVPDPAPGPGQVLIRVHAVGVNPVETYIRAGTYARKPNLPYIPGSDVGGTVEKVGSERHRLQAWRSRLHARRVRRLRAAAGLR